MMTSDGLVRIVRAAAGRLLRVPRLGSFAAHLGLPLVLAAAAAGYVGSRAGLPETEEAGTRASRGPHQLTPPSALRARLRKSVIARHVLPLGERRREGLSTRRPLVGYAVSLAYIGYSLLIAVLATVIITRLRPEEAPAGAPQGPKATAVGEGAGNANRAGPAQGLAVLGIHAAPGL